MKLDDHDPLFSEWSRSEAWRSDDSPSTTPSLAPHAISIDDWEADESYGPVSRPVSPEHLRKLQRYVKATVAGCAVLCVAAIGRVGVSRVLAAHEAEAPATFAAAHAAEVPRVSPPPSLPIAPAVAAPVAVAAPPPLAVTAPAPATLAARPVAAAAPKTALQERESARRSLERGRPRDAIDAGERATALDATDAEAWLILGAAHQELGHVSAARAAFRSCAQSATRGPVRECRAMLR